MKITIDCRMINSSGVGVYLRGTLPLLLQSEHKFLLLGNPALLESYIKNSNIEIIDCNIKPFSINELLFFPIKILKKINSSSLFYSPFFNIPKRIKIPVYTTIHDIAFPDVPELTSRIGLAARMWFFHRAYRRSKKVFTVSNFSKSRIEYHLGKKIIKPVIVTYSSVQPSFLAWREKIPSIQKKDTILFIGNIKKHKGLNILLEAFLEAKKTGLAHKLIIIGEKDKFRTFDNKVIKKIEAAGNPDVSFSGHISTEELIRNLAEAALLVQPSLYEGFGLPPLEAMVLGTHALISDIQVFKEIYAEYPVTFFKAGDIEDLKKKLLELLLNTPPSPVLSRELLFKYSFEKTTDCILKEIK